MDVCVCVVGQCLLDGEYVPETTVFCEKQVGCRAIQKTGHCCPDYRCGKLLLLFLHLTYGGKKNYSYS